MGKKAVPVAYLASDQNRRNTFKKRLVGLMKKAHDLSILCGAEIALIVVDESGEISPYTMNTKNESIEDVWARYACTSKEAKVRRLSMCKELLELDTNKAEVARQAKKDINREPQNCGLHQYDWSNFSMQQNQANQGSTSSTMQCQPNVNNAMMSPIEPNMNNGEVYVGYQQHGVGNVHFEVGNVNSQVGNVHSEVGNVQYGTGNVHNGMGTHGNQGVGAHQQQHGAHQGNGANFQNPIKTSSFEEEWPTPTNSSFSNYLDHLDPTDWGARVSMQFGNLQ